MTELDHIEAKMREALADNGNRWDSETLKNLAEARRHWIEGELVKLHLQNAKEEAEWRKKHREVMLTNAANIGTAGVM